MFLFGCCQTVQSGKGFEVKRRNQKNEQIVTFVSSLSELDAKELKDPSTTILKLQKSQYEELMKQYKGTEKKWVDPLFSPNQDSLGKIDDVQNNQWKRISDILNKPALFDGKVQPKDVIQGSLGDCYFLSALAALAQKEERIKKVFGNQQFNPNGIYKVTMRIDGVIQEILVDDYIPVNSKGEPLFCQPNKNQFWVLILEKAWAKAHGSYANIVAGNPTEVFKAVTYAPAQMILLKQSQEQRQKLWRTILDYAIKDYPCCCGTDDNQNIDWQQLGLVPGHAYTLIDARVVEHRNGKQYRMLKLRNPWGDTEWQGQGCQRDEEFWRNIIESQQKVIFTNKFSKNNDGVFFITYPDFCKYFSQTHFCLLQPNANYMSEQLFSNKKNGSIYTFEVQKSGDYTFELHQSGIRGEDIQKIQDGLSRATLLIARQDERQYKFIDGALKYNDEDATLKTHLAPGKHLLFAKLDPSRKYKKIPENSSVSVYSIEYTDLKQSQQKLHPDFLKKMFLEHAKNHKRNHYNNNQMWISWKLLFQQGGYAYIALGNSNKSDKKFIVSFDEEQFNNMSFTLKKSFKGKGNGQIVEVSPGEQKIILARVKNVPIKSLKFPPQLGIKIEKANS